MKIVAVIGASKDRDKFGNKAVRGFRQAGYEVIPIHPLDDEIEGIQAYGSVLEVPGDIDIATLYVPPNVGERLVDEIVQKKIPLLWLNPGADGPGVIKRAQAFGLELVIGCSLIAIGESPSKY
jgi:hypothetical protein